jgi:hypothetical protein
MVPTFGGEIAHVTAVFEVPCTVAVNCCVCPSLSVAAVGVMLTDTVGVKVTVAVLNMFGCWTKYAVIVIVKLWKTDVGAVYSPVLESVPIVGLNDQATVGLKPLGTLVCAANCTDCP